MNGLFLIYQVDLMTTDGKKVTNIGEISDDFGGVVQVEVDGIWIWAKKELNDSGKVEVLTPTEDKKVKGIRRSSDDLTKILSQEEEEE